MALYSTLQKFITKEGVPVSGASVNVKLSGGAVDADLFATRTGTNKGNPFLTTANGEALCYVKAGRYDMTVTKGIDQVVFKDIEVGQISNVGTFAEGGVITDPDQLVEDADGNQWSYTGALNHTYPSGTNPKAASGWKSVSITTNYLDSASDSKIALHNSQSNAHPELSVFITREADRAETAAYAAETRAQTAYREAVEAASSGKNTVRYDDQGNPNILVWINKCNSEDLNAAILARHGKDFQLGTGVFPAFIKNGVQMRGFWYAKYQASNGANGGCSVVSGVSPKTSVNYDVAKALCVNKGLGWHLSADIEWMAVAFIGLAFGEQPRGDTNYGRAHDAKHETSKSVSAAHAPGDTAHSAPSLCGTGPNSWSHDGTEFGVFDMVGNVWEWQDQLKMQEGQIFAPLDNNPEMDEALWPSHECFLDSSGATSGSVILNSLISNRTGDLGDNGSGNGDNTNTWASTAKDPSYVESLLMRQLGIESAHASSLQGGIYSRNFGERLPLRGANWYYGGDAGLGALHFYGDRTGAHSSFGFRPAYFES